MGEARCIMYVQVKYRGGVRTERYICRLCYMRRMLSAFDKEIAKD